MKPPTRSVVTARDANDRSRTIVKVQTWINAGSLSGPSWIEGLVSYELPNGHKLTPVGPPSEGEYKIVGIGERVFLDK